MRSFLAILALAAMLAACVTLTGQAVEKTIEQQDRADLVRCQNQDAGWAQACRRVQQVQTHYQQPTITHFNQ